MCYRRITIAACSCVLRNHKLCPHSKNIIAETPDNTTQGDIQTNPQQSTKVNDHTNQPENATTASQGTRSKDNAQPVTASQKTSTAPTVTVKVSTPPPSPDASSGTLTPLNAGASPFAPTPSPLGPTTSVPLGQTSSVGATASSPAIHAPLGIDTPSRSTTNSPSTGNFFYYTRIINGYPYLCVAPAAPATSFGTTTPSAVMSAPVAPTTGTTTPSSAVMYTPISFTSTQALANPEASAELSKVTLAELRTNPSVRTPLPSGYYPRQATSAQRHVHWNEYRVEWVDCVAFYSTHLYDLPHMTAAEKEQEHRDCPENFGDQDVTVVQLGLCRDCQGYHYDVASKGEGGVNVVEWGRLMALANNGGLDSGSARMGQTGQGQGQGQGQSHGQGNGQTQGGGQQRTQSEQKDQSQQKTKSPQTKGQQESQQQTQNQQKNQNQNNNQQTEMAKSVTRHTPKHDPHHPNYQPPPRPPKPTQPYPRPWWMVQTQTHKGQKSQTKAQPQTQSQTPTKGQTSTAEVVVEQGRQKQSNANTKSDNSTTRAKKMLMRKRTAMVLMRTGLMAPSSR